MNLSRENPRLFLSRGLLSVFGYALGCALWYTSLSFWLTSREYIWVEEISA